MGNRFVLDLKAKKKRSLTVLIFICTIVKIAKSPWTD